MFEQKDKSPFMNRNKPRNTAPKKQQQRRLDAHEFKLIEAKRSQQEMKFNTPDGRITGKVTNFDKYSIIVADKSTGAEICLFKHAVHSFAPSEYTR